MKMVARAYFCSTGQLIDEGVLNEIDKVMNAASLKLSIIK
jgi:hypothetical protein